MYLLMLIVVAVITAYADFALLTNFKASVLMAAGTAFALFLNYFATINSVASTQKEYRAGIFPSWNWVRVELDTTVKAFLFAAGCIAVIIIAWYLPHSYNINWFGVITVLIIVPVSSVLAGVLGTKRGLQKHAA